MLNEKLSKRIEELGYKASEALVAEVEEIAISKVPDSIIRQAGNRHIKALRDAAIAAKKAKPEGATEPAPQPPSPAPAAVV